MHTPLRAPQSLRRGAPLLLGGALAAAATLSLGLARGGPPASHGAMAMDQQMAKLAAWQGPSAAVATPRGMDPKYFASTVPTDNPGTEAQVALGRKLYFETRLSKDGTLACATCHDVSRGFTDRRGTSEGLNDQLGRRNAPTTLNALFFQTQFWDGRAASLEEQAKLPILNPIEMGQPTGAAAIAGIAADAEYVRAFQAAYGRPVNYDDVGRALASFERTLVFISAPFDRFAAGDVTAISDDARAGWALFNGKGRCAACHQMNNANPVGTDNRFHNVGVAATHHDFKMLAQKALDILAKDSSPTALDHLALETDLSELGRFMVTRNRADIGSFKTEQVRNVGITGPYMHDGSMVTLWDVMDHYNKGGEVSPYLDGGIEPLDLTEHEVDQLVAFLFSLTDDRFAAENAAEMTRQQAIALKSRPLRDDARAHRKVLTFEAAPEGKK